MYKYYCEQYENWDQINLKVSMYSNSFLCIRFIYNAIHIILISSYIKLIINWSILHKYEE